MAPWANQLLSGEIENRLRLLGIVNCDASLLSVSDNNLEAYPHGFVATLPSGCSENTSAFPDHAMVHLDNLGPYRYWYYEGSGDCGLAAASWKSLSHNAPRGERSGGPYGGEVATVRYGRISTWRPTSADGVVYN